MKIETKLDIWNEVNKAEIESQIDITYIRVEDLVQELIDFGASEKSLFDFYVYVNDLISKRSKPMLDSDSEFSTKCRKDLSSA